MRSRPALQWGHVPIKYREQLRRYIELGEPPTNHLLIAVLTNDLTVSVMMAEPEELIDLVVFVYRNCPEASGSGEAIARWERRGGLVGAAVY
jgi:hypothetical protein